MKYLKSKSSQSKFHRMFNLNFEMVFLFYFLLAFKCQKFITDILSFLVNEALPLVSFLLEKSK